MLLNAGDEDKTQNPQQWFFFYGLGLIIGLDSGGGVRKS